MESFGPIGNALGGYSSHWFECSNGHPYFIGECGGAAQVSICIECGVAIGGQNYQLAAGNRNAADLLRDVGLQPATGTEVMDTRVEKDMTLVGNEVKKKRDARGKRAR